MPVYQHNHTPPAIVMKVGDKRPVPLTTQLRKEYERLYTTQVANPKYASTLNNGLNMILKNMNRYKIVEAKSRVPWYVVGILHLLEADCNFNKHLHNGDPLNHKTVHAPAGRPPIAKWTWEDSAVDALQLEREGNWAPRGLKQDDWGIAATLYRLEAWNGFGSRIHGVATPYLWSGTQFYKIGKFRADGKWDPSLVSGQIGAAPLLKALEVKKYIVFVGTFK